MATPKKKALTYRVELIPPRTTPDQLIGDFFISEDRDYLTVKSLCPSVESVEGEEEKELTATMLFRPRTNRSDGPRRIKDTHIQVGKDFIGFTPLYVPPAEKGPIAADIIAITGLAAHAFGSWAESEDTMWLRDYLKDHAPNARILTYGYNSELQNGPNTILQDHTTRFVEMLGTMRQEGQCESRPIIFVGHSLGCLIIKKALIDTASKSILPVRTILFLAAPHQGINVAALQTLVRGHTSEKIVEELLPESPTLLDLNERFVEVAYGMEIHSFYETFATRTVTRNEDGSWGRNGPAVMMVTRESARLLYPRESRFGAWADHSQIAKVMRGQSGLFPQIRSAIRKALSPTANAVAEDHHGLNRDFKSHGASYRIPPPLPVHIVNKGKNVYSNSTASQSNGELASQKTFGVPERVSTPFQPSIGILPRLPDRGPSPASDGIKIQEKSPGPIKVPVHRGSSNQTPPQAKAMPPQPEATQGRTATPESTHVPTTEVKKGDVLADSNDESIPNDNISTAAAQGGASKQNEANDAIHGNTAPAVSSVSNKTSVYVSTSAYCKICHDGIPESYPHYACGQCLHSTETEECEQCFCYSCFEKTAECHQHKALMELFIPVGNSRHAYYIDDQVSRFDTGIVKAIKQDDSQLLQSRVGNERLLKAYDNMGSTPLHLAAKLGRSECARILLSHGAPKNWLDASNKTPLCSAVHYNHVKMVRILLKNGVDINAFHGGETALSCAVKNGQDHMVLILLQRNAIIELEYAPTVLVEAASKGNLKTVELLLLSGANVDLKEKESGDCALSRAASKGHYSIVKKLISRHADVNAVNKQNETPLHIAVRSGSRDIVRLLLEQRAKVRTSSLDGYTPIYDAVKLGYPETAHLLLNRGVDIRSSSGHSDTLLHDAVRSGSLATIRLLLEQGVERNKKLLHDAVKSGSLLAVRSCLEEGADVDAKEGKDSIPLLIIAFSNNHFSIVKMLLNHGANVNSKDSDGYTCLHLAAKQGNLEICESLIKSSADVSIKTSAKTTDASMIPLHLATKYNHGPIIDLLLHHTTNIDQKDGKGRTCVHWAAENGSLKICESLLLRGASALDPKDDKLETPLYLANKGRHSAVVGLLLRHGADPNQRCGRFFPLYDAARHGDIESLRYLVEHKADLDMEATNGFNAVSGAAYGGHVDAVEFLLENGACDRAPSNYERDWKNHYFAKSVDDAKQEETLRMIRTFKHR